MIDYDVIVPTHNHAKFIEQSLTSIVNQTIQPKTIIIVNDNSTDHSETLINKFISANKKINIVLFNNKIQLGPGQSRNIGISMSRSKYLSFLDSDDIWYANKIEEQQKRFLDPNFNNLGIVYCSHVFINNNKKYFDLTTFQKAQLRGYIFYNLFSGNKISGSCSSVLCKREIFNSCGVFNNDYHYVEDWEFFIRVAEKYNFDYVDKYLLEIRIHDTNRSKLLNEKILKQFKKKIDELCKNKNTPIEIKKILINELKISSFKTHYNRLRQYRLFRSIIKNSSALILYIFGNKIHYKIKLLCRKILTIIITKKFEKEFH
jgi:glycosyltransferase involved in cell wall biosynthesis